jgi:hypothetical protein
VNDSWLIVESRMMVSPTWLFFTSTVFDTTNWA